MFVLMMVTFFGTQALAARTDSGLTFGERAAGKQWVKRASLSAVAMEKALVDASLAHVSGARPIILLETNYYTFLAGEPLELRVTIDPNGFGSAVTMYLYQENRITGERRYHSVAGGLLPAGQQADLFGSVSSRVPVFVPALNDFVLFGSTGTSSDLSWNVAGALGGATTVPAGQPGLHQWVMELRDAAGKRVLARSNAMYSFINGSVEVSGTITSSTTWTANQRYVLNDFVGVAAPAVLTIEPGTVIYGGDTRATLFIQRGAKIIADGTARRPIVFTSPQRVGSRAQQDWGSLVVFGRAPINVEGGQSFMEGLASLPEFAYGGTDPADSSGILRYVRLEFGGFLIATNQEINGLTLCAVGTGTVVDYVQVLHNADDAFEFFGGTVNASHLLGVAYADDGLDFDLGYIGSVQFAVLIKRPNDEADGNILTESDNNGQGSGATPLTSPLVYNVTGVRTAATNGNYGAVLRRNTAGKFYNMIVQGSKNAPLSLRDASTASNANSGLLVFDNSILFGDFSDAAFPGRTDGEQSRNFVFTTNTRNRNVDPKLAMDSATVSKTYLPDLEPLADSPALDADFVAIPPDNGFLQVVDYQGAIGPGDNWILTGWANFSDN
ncbi:MAG TPA: hypothetical protein VMS98_09750 [Thermoanaerobaculia bacterium]|nr:hypothetical protein [Thermoanaerobaculia bacterium]